jgi:hypothetical protein
MPANEPLSQDTPQNRDANRDSTTGRFVKGNNANPGGRPKAIVEFRALAQCWALDDGIQMLIDVANRRDGGQDWRFACEQLLAYAFGRPPVGIDDLTEERLSKLEQGIMSDQQSGSTA